MIYQSPIPTLGGKRKLMNELNEVFEYITDCRSISLFADMFTGSGTCIVNNSLEHLPKIGVDKDLGMISFLECLKTESTVEDLIDKILIFDEIIYDKTIFYDNDSDMNYKDRDIIEVGAITFLKAHYSRAADRQNFTESRLPKGISINLLESLFTWSSRLENVEFIHNDFLSVFTELDQRDGVLFYMDPPYIRGNAPKPTTGYNNPFDITDHQKLVQAAIQSKNAIVISGYRNSIYTQLEENGFYRYHLREVNVFSSSKGMREQEYIWSNVEIPFLD